MFVLVRHAHAGDKQTWSHPDVERPLSELGHQQARALVDLLAGAQIRRVLTSPVVRCRATVEPVAAARGLAVEEVHLLEPDADPRALERMLVHEDAAGALLCTHGEYMDRLLTRWQREGRLNLQGHGAVDTAKGAAWVVERFGAADATARYLPAVPPEPDAGS